MRLPVLGCPGILPRSYIAEALPSFADMGCGTSTPDYAGRETLWGEDYPTWSLDSRSEFWSGLAARAGLGRDEERGRFVLAGSSFYSDI